jgi:hypothetical protein
VLGFTPTLGQSGVATERLYFKDLYVPKPDERTPLVTQIHEDLGHAGEERTLTEVCKRYF